MTEDFWFFIILFLAALLLSILTLISILMKKLVKKSCFPAIVKRFPALISLQGLPFYRETIALGTIWYKNCATLMSTEDGLFLSFGFPISLIYSETAFIPWDYITYAGKNQTFWTDISDYLIDMDSQVRLSVPDRVAQSFPKSFRQEYGDTF